jgi:hypothetical protein
MLVFFLAPGVIFATVAMAAVYEFVFGNVPAHGVKVEQAISKEG